MSDPWYRVRQWLNAVRAAPLTPEEQARVRAVLNSACFELYQTMPPGDQRHALRIFDALAAHGYRARPLLEAALLHDAAKRDMGLGYRTLVIVLNRLSPHAVARLAAPVPASWRYPFYVSLHHPERGAELAAAAGADPRAVLLIRLHQTGTLPDGNRTDGALAEWHRALKTLDDAN